MMHLLEWPIILYLSFHLIGGFFVLGSVLGIPGQLDETRPLVRRLSRFIGILVNLAFSGLSVLFIGAVLAFYFHYITIGILLSSLNLVLGLLLFTCMIWLYRIK